MHFDPTTLRLITIVIAVFAGVSFFVLSKYARLPAIVLLLAGGVFLGPEFLGILQPSAFGGDLRIIISLCVAIILFEGGLTLNPDGLKKAPKVIWQLLTIGVLTTWFGIAALVYFFLDLSVRMSLLAGSLVIVTGPTVIAPLLKRLRVKDKLFHILHWEGVLIDPIGVFIAILCFEFVGSADGFMANLTHFGYRVLVGMVFGYAGGKIIAWLIVRHWIQKELVNIFVFGAALFLFVVSDLIVHESGILTVVVAGLVIGLANPPELKHMRQFKSELTELSIAIVFMLLSAGLKMESFTSFGWNGALLMVAILVFVRPISIFLSSIGTGLSLNEKLFLSWIAPRGVIAGSMASLFAVQLVTRGFPEAAILETFTFSVIAATIVIQGTSAGYVAQMLNVGEREKRDWLIIGAHRLSQEVAKFITETTGEKCILVDTNADAVKLANEAGCNAIEGNALSLEILESELTNSIGRVMALTDNRDLNQLSCERWAETVDKKNLYRWSSRHQNIEANIAGVGNPIWQEIEKPSALAHDLDCNEAHLVMMNAKEGDKKPAFMQFDTDRYHFDKVPAKDFKILALEAERTGLAGFVLPENILSVTGNDYQLVLKSALSQVQQLRPTQIDSRIISAVLTKEEKHSSILANGVAVPHFHLDNLVNPLCFLVRVDGQISLDTFDEHPIDLIFLLFSPKDKPELHLQMLSEIAKSVKSREQVEQIHSVSDAEVFGLLMAAQK